MPQFNSKMNALKEVSRLIDESNPSSSFKPTFSVSSSAGGSGGGSRGFGRAPPGGSNNELIHIKEERIVEWMSDNRVLSVALEGNIDQIQYTARIKAIVEFLGARLALEELTKMWNLQVSALDGKEDCSISRKLIYCW